VEKTLHEFIFTNNAARTGAEATLCVIIQHRLKQKIAPISCECAMKFAVLKIMRLLLVLVNYFRRLWQKAAWKLISGIFSDLKTLFWQG